MGAFAAKGLPRGGAIDSFYYKEFYYKELLIQFGTFKIQKHDLHQKDELLVKNVDVNSLSEIQPFVKLFVSQHHPKNS